MKVYLAGPDVFLPDAIEIGRRKQAICARFGLTGLYPLDNVVALDSSDASLQIFRANQAMMLEADAIIANLTPFRGPSADAGSASVANTARTDRRARMGSPRASSRYFAVTMKCARRFRANAVSSWPGLNGNSLP